ncbi:protein mono-ADP-ribosyltransferase PARP14 [Amblyraja radiata]|uniref:protein mono-ADP-ribosyltransferase PARP14 n=1 Tax=Amblyraja radiata TaxID=386614 RepID=UPI00140265BB|nr:protein mono-ADP-ribosyltransferase PARP14 [Amblyraja radiata]
MAAEDVFPYPLVVEGEWDQDVAKLLKNKLQIYFQSRKQCDGGECVVEYEDLASNQAVVRFASDQTRNNVLKKETHQIDLRKRGIIHFTVRLPSQAAAERDGTTAAAQSPGKNNTGCARNQPTTGDDAQAVLMARDRSVENIPLTVKRKSHHESSQILQSSSVVLQNLSNNITYELLALLVEKLTDLNEADDDFTMEILSEIDAAVVTFKVDIDPFEFAQKCSKKVLLRQNIEARVLETSRSLRVENLPASITEDHLRLYFESAKNGNGIVSSVELTTEHDAAVISFENSEVVDFILSRAHMIEKAPVNVYLYYKSLSSALYGNKRPVVKMPDPFMFDVDCYILQFLKNNEGRIAEISDKMSACYCKIIFPELGQSNSIKISPTFSRHSSFEKLAKGWKKEACDTLTSILSKYNTFTCNVNQSIWEIIKHEVDQYLNQNVAVIPHISKEKVIITGVIEPVDILQQRFNSIMNNAIEKIEREKESITQRVPINLTKYFLLVNDGLEDSVSKQFPDLHIKFNSHENNLTLHGLPSEVYNAKSKILENIILIKETKTNLDPCLRNFIQNVSCKEVSSCLFASKDISAAVDIQDNSVVLIGSTDHLLCAAEEQIRKHLAFKSIAIRDLNVIGKNEWTHLKQKLGERLNSQRIKVEIEEKTSNGGMHIIIAGYTDSVEEVYENLNDFVKKNTIIQRNIPFKSRGVLQFLVAFDKIKNVQSTTQDVKIKVNDGSNHASVSVTGPEENVNHVENSLSDAASKIVTEVLQITTPGTKKFYKEKEEIYGSIVKDKFDCILRLIEHSDMEGNDLSQFYCQVQLPNGPVITVNKGDLCKAHVDVVVNAANENLKHIGGLAKALFDTAGAVLQEECDRIVNQQGPLVPGDAVITEAGMLPCSKVIHAVGPRWMDTNSNTAVKRLKNAVKESLRLAEIFNFKSIAIPAISSGIFGFPLALCADTIVTSIREHFVNLRGDSTLKEIHLTNFDDETVQAVAKAVQKIFGHLIGNAPVPLERPASGNRRKTNSCLQAQTKEGLNILLVKGNIQDITAAVIVNVIGMDLKLSLGAISKALLQKAGPQLERLLEKETKGKQPQNGQIYETKGCNLDCNEVYHAIVPYWQAGTGNTEKVLKNLIKDCLKNTEGSNLDSIAFPAIGTGNLCFPKDVVASIMFQAVLKFSTDRKPAHLKTVYIVVHPDDYHNVQAMICEFKRVFMQQPKTGVRSEEQKPTGPLFGKMSLVTPEQAEMQMGPILLQVVPGDITKETADAIVNSSNKTFTLKSGVSKAILDAAGQAVETECQQKGSQQNNGIILTNPGNLACRHIVHIIGQTVPNEIKTVVNAVLQICEQQEFSSISFPALGTGQGRANPSQVADAMLDSVADFINTTPSPSLRKIRIVIFQPHMLNEFHSSMKKHETSTSPENESVLKKIAHTFTYFFGSHPKENKESFIEDTIEFKDEIEPVRFEICGKSKQGVENTISWMKNIVSREQSEETIDSNYLFDFSEKEFEELKHLNKSLNITLDLKRDQSGAQIKICGLTKDVLTTFTKIQKMINCLREKESERRNEDLVKNLVEWQFQDGIEYKPFTSATNFMLEAAFGRDLTSTNIQLHGKPCFVDLKTLTATIKGYKTICLKRVLKTEGLLTDALPDHWDGMKNMQYTSVQLHQESQEYQNVEQSFKASANTFQIVKIERIQTPCLWKNYMIKKQLFEDKNPAGTNNERNLFHGTASDTLESVSRLGFNRSYAGRNATVYGNGTYFAVNAMYSANGTYSKPDANGMKYMYRARVLTGVFCLGQSGMLTPPSKNSSNPTDLYDSVVENVNNPSMFIIFNDIQAYPEYLITFK